MCLQHNKFKKSNFKNVRSYILKLLSNYTKNSGQIKIDSYTKLFENVIESSKYLIHHNVENNSFMTFQIKNHIEFVKFAHISLLHFP